MKAAGRLAAIGIFDPFEWVVIFSICEALEKTGFR